MADLTTRMKVLLAPAYDHNFSAGPGRWLAGNPNGYPAGDYSVGQYQDNYYPTPNQNNSGIIVGEGAEPWWPAETNIYDPSQQFCWDADQRAVSERVWYYGTKVGNLRNFFDSDADEMALTKNRRRATGNPISSWNKSDTTFVDTTNFLEAGSGYTAVGAYPDHYQDAVHDAIIQGSNPADTTTANKLIYPNKPGTDESGSGVQGYGIYQSTMGSQYSGHWNKAIPQNYAGNAGSGRNEPEPYTYAYEYTLNIESLTHTWSTLTSVLPLPGPIKSITGKDTTQLVNLAVDIGAMREQIQIKGKVYDGHTDPYAAPYERTIRKQQLMDIVRGQWSALSSPELSGTGAGKTMMQPNRFPALTIGPMHTLNPNGDQGRTFKITPHPNTKGTMKKSMGEGVYKNPGEQSGLGARKSYHLKAIDMWRYGQEPSDDLRGSPLFVDDPTADYVTQVWDYQFGYSGRRRYRGMITRLGFTLVGGSPDVWDYTLDFAVLKNETTYRRESLDTDPPPKEEGD